MFGNPRFLLERESLKPKSAGQTLARLVAYFKPFWPVVLVAVLFMLLSTWAQVTTPELTGQIVDCYLTPGSASAFSNSSLAGEAEAASLSSCWLAGDEPANGLTQSAFKAILGWLNSPVPFAAGELTPAARS